METTCQASYPLNSENASPFGTCKPYLSCWARATPPNMASPKPNAAAEAPRKPRKGEEGLSNMARSLDALWKVACFALQHTPERSYLQSTAELETERYSSSNAARIRPRHD